MWIYERKLQYPVRLKNTNPKLASVILSQLGGPDGELGAATRYLNQRFSMTDGKVIGILTDIGSEELGHAEMISAIIHQLTRNLTPDEIKAAGVDKYFVDHTLGTYPASASGVPFTAAYIGVKGDPVADLNEDLAADAAIMQEQHLSNNQPDLLKNDKDKLFSQMPGKTNLKQYRIFSVCQRNFRLILRIYINQPKFFEN